MQHPTASTLLNAAGPYSVGRVPLDLVRSSMSSEQGLDVLAFDKCYYSCLGAPPLQSVCLLTDASVHHPCHGRTAMPTSPAPSSSRHQTGAKILWTTLKTHRSAKPGGRTSVMTLSLSNPSAAYLRRRQSNIISREPTVQPSQPRRETPGLPRRGAARPSSHASAASLGIARGRLGPCPALSC